jgi:S-adenosylmethionine-diacylgycerolhomoserine-N-methlytransferase
MLKTARRTFERRGIAEKIQLRECLAEQMDYRATFGLERPFDAIFFSYGLSMIPTWQDALETALKNLKPGGVLYIVDFWDQAELPGWFRAMLKRWLTLFHVQFRAELLDYLEALRERHGAALSVRSIHRRYAYIATLALPTFETEPAAQARELAACPM